MTRSAPPQRSFASGEVSPTLAGRTDYIRVQTGAETCRGFIVTPEGAVTRAPGTIYEGRTKDDAPARLVEFEFNTDDAVLLELTAGWLRFWRYGEQVMGPSSPYQVATPWSFSQVKGLKWIQSADRIFMVDGAQAPRRLSRTALDDWTLDLAPFTGGPLRPWNTDESVTVEADGETGTVTLTATGGDVFDAGMIGSVFALRVVDWSDVPLWTGNTDFAVDDLVRYDGRVYRCADAAATADKNVSPPTHDKGTVLSTKGGPSWQFRSTNTGLVEITAVASGTSATAKVVDRIPSELVGAGTWEWAPGAWSDLYGWPAAVCLHDQRAFFAATPTEQRTVWGSAIGTILDFAEGVNADQAFAYSIAAQRGLNAIVWVASSDKGLSIGATGEVHGARSSIGDETVSAETAAFGVVATVGAHHVQPIAPSGRPIYISRDQTRAVELRYSLQDDGTKPRVLSMPARHLGADRFDVIAWQSSPLPIAWIVRKSGDLVAMIYDPDEDVLGWCRVPVAGGVVEEVAVTAAPDGGEDEVRLVVRREIGGETRRHIERLSPFWGLLTGEMKIAEANHLYAAKEFVFEEPATKLTGLDHLEGETVLVWTDYGQFGPFVVAAGKVALDFAVNRAFVGLEDKTQRLRPLDFYAPTRTGDGMGRPVKLSRIGVRLLRSAGYKIRSVMREWGKADTLGSWIERRGGDVPGELVTGWSGVDWPNVSTGFAPQVTADIEPIGAAPLTILALTPTVEAQE
ncbi:hypothetical protein P2H44_22675 [Albimonas sp. CAU 1670]|uniref:hypothetical protein n=1 Tax=Albimonas sp. CAU 1670 TaxID=3032599 RepID=UPI0023DCBE90|nr:hypothetical protein [Albimonas sp. CAU 1670]MDF2235370.1 hypothetical protein [Albimonas sp. CAU 1670]